MAAVEPAPLTTDTPSPPTPATALSSKTGRLRALATLPGSGEGEFMHWDLPLSYWWVVGVGEADRLAPGSFREP